MAQKGSWNALASMPAGKSRVDFSGEQFVWVIQLSIIVQSLVFGAMREAALATASGLGGSNTETR